MKPEDLMIGDWFRFRYTIDGKEIVHTFRISRIEDELGDYYVWGEGFGRMCYPKRLEPIPLTPEILEKNGFEKRYNYQWEYRDNSRKIVISIAPQIEIDGEIIGTPPINIMLEGALFTMNITSDCYVHDLQHIIRHAGIDEEIVL